MSLDPAIKHRVAIEKYGDKIEPDLLELLLRLGAVGVYRRQAMFNLETFVQAAEIGMGGHLVMRAPRRGGAPVEVAYASASAQLSFEFGDPV